MSRLSKGLKTTGNIAIALIKAVHASADAFPPLKSATGGTLHIVELVSTFKTNKAEWIELGEYIGDAVARIVDKMASSKPTDPKREFGENIKKLQQVLEEIEGEISEIKLHGMGKRLRTYFDDPHKILVMRGKVENIFKLFELSASIDMSIAIEETLKKSDIRALSEVIVANITNSLSKEISTEVKIAIAPQIKAASNRSALDSLPFAEGASWDPNSGCLDGTRETLIGEVEDWVSMAPERGGAAIYWLKDVAGSGKSSLAHEIAQRYHRSGHLAASFFFNRDTADRNSPKKMWSTIAREMAAHNPLLAANMADILEKDPAVATASPLRQFQSLILGSCKSLPPSTPTVIVIDALDEGVNTESDEEILVILRDEFPHLPDCYCVFLTSRPSDNIEYHFKERDHIVNHSLNLDSDANVTDLANYIRSRLLRIAVRRDLEGSWPGEETLQLFIERAERLFIWAAIICEYIGRATDPEGELEQFLSNEGRGLLAESKMDQLYSSILNRCIWDTAFTQAYLVILGTIMAAKRPISKEALKALHRGALKPKTVEAVLKQLGSVLGSSADDQGPLRIIHQSFRDFITGRAAQSSETRRYSINENNHSANLAMLCFKIINEEASDLISGTGYLIEENRDAGIPEVGGVSEQLWYACEFCISHLASVESPENGPLLVEIHKFLTSRLILWMEIVSSKGAGSVQSIYGILKWIKPTETDPTPNSFDLSSTASALFKLSLRLYYDRRLEDAFTASNDAVRISRDLARKQPELLNADLAASLNNLSLRQSDLGRREEALASIEEAVELYRHLAKERPAAFNQELAMSLNNLSLWKTNLGRREEALASIEDAVELYRPLAKEQPAEFNPDLAMSLSNLSTCQSDLGRREEALASVEEAVELRRSLAKERPAAFNPELAKSLNNLSAYLSNLGSPEEALASIEESVELYRRLEKERPSAFYLDLAMSLNNLSNRKSDLGRCEEALASVEEAVELHRRLATERPAAFNPDLAMSLNNLSACQYDLGRREEALASIEESVELRRRLAEERPAAFNSDLAMSLYNLSTYQAELGRHEEALASVEEAVEMRRRLAKERPAAFNPDLAISLYNLSIFQSNLERREEALASIQEAVELYRSLAEERPAIFGSSLADSLEVLSNCQSALHIGDTDSDDSVDSDTDHR